MARNRNTIDRISETTSVKVKVFNVETDDVEIVTVALPTKYTTQSGLYRAVKKLIPENKRFLSINPEISVDVTHYVMDIEDFYKSAEKGETESVTINITDLN